MRRFTLLAGLLVLAGCPGSSQQPAQAPMDPAQKRKAQVELETQMAEGTVQAESEAAQPMADAVAGELAKDTAKTAEAAKKLPEMRYYAFDG